MMESADEVFSWAGRFSDAIHRADEVRKLRAQIYTARTTCGSCRQWMTRDCPREVHSNQTGRWTGPSSLTIKCDRFSMKASDEAGIAGAEAKIAQLLAATASTAQPPHSQEADRG